MVFFTQEDPIPVQIHKEKWGQNLLAACEAANLCQFLDALAEKPDVDFSGKNGFTPLIYAVDNAFDYGIIKLIERKADVNKTNNGNETPLMRALYKLRGNTGFDRYSTIETLIAAGADPNIKDKDGKTPLMVATDLNDARCVAMLLNAGSTPNASMRGLYSNRLTTALTIASEKDNEAIITMLLTAGADPDALSAYDRKKYTLLIQQVQEVRAAQKQTQETLKKPQAKRGWYRKKIGHRH